MGEKNKVTPYFSSMVHLLKQFQKENGRFPYKYEKYHDVDLGTWACTQRYFYRKGVLSQAQEDLLRNTGLLSGGVFYLYDKVNAVQTFYNKYNRFPFYDEYIGGIPLGHWWSAIQKKIREYLLTETELQYIQENYPIIYFYAKNKGIKTIENWISLLLDYQKETGKTCPATREKFRGVGLGQWCKNIRCQARKKELSIEVLNLLLPTNILDNL